ncbi:MAG: hypothetical protein KDD48_08905, partial [Bdellovibrionales bacterium]|nr:hypothetical protein [Bdellovibrionales bacterium]
MSQSLVRLVVSFLFVFSFSVFADGPLRAIVIFGNTKTERKTVLNIMSVPSRSYVDANLIKQIDDRLVNSGLFQSVNVSSRNNPDGTADIRVTVTEKQLWFAFPIVQAWSGRYSFGAAFGESNLLFPSVKTLLAFQGGNRLNRFFYAMDAQNIFDGNFSFRFWTLARKDQVPIYSGVIKTEEVGIKDVSVSILPGYQWTNEIRTSLGAKYKYIDYGLSATVP